MKTKKELIKEYLLTGKGITSRIAREKFGCYALSAVRNSLRLELPTIKITPYEAYEKGIFTKEERDSAFMSGLSVYCVPPKVLKELQ